MTPVPFGDSSGSMNQINRHLPHQTSERGMVQTPRRVRTQRASGDGVSGSGEDRPVRQDLVRQLKAQILSGEYDSPAKMEVAADRMALDVLA